MLTPFPPILALLLHYAAGAFIIVFHTHVVLFNYSTCASRNLLLGGRTAFTDDADELNTFVAPPDGRDTHGVYGHSTDTRHLLAERRFLGICTARCNGLLWSRVVPKRLLRLLLPRQLLFEDAWAKSRYSLLESAEAALR